MSNKKSILIIDTPSSCVMCPLSAYNEYYNEHLCQGTNSYYRTIEVYGAGAEKPTWCPLSPLPEKRDLTRYVQRGDAKSITHMVMYMYDQGWNDCVDQLLEGEN